MRLLIMDEQDQIGGAQIVLLQLLENLTHSGLTMAAILQGPGILADRLGERHIATYFHDFQKVKQLWLHPFHVRSNRNRLSTVIKQVDPDVIICNSPWIVAVAGPVIKRCRIRSIGVAHAAVRPKRFLKRLVMHYLIRNSMQSMSSWIAVSESIRTDLMRFGIRSCSVIPNGVDLNVFTPGATGQLRAEFGLSSDDVLIITSGRIHPGKGQLDVIEGLAPIIAGNPRVHLIIAGTELEDAIENLGFTSQLRSLVQKLGIDRNVHFVGFRSDMHVVLRDADIMVSGSYQESFGLSVLEAMACGLPVIVTDVSGHRKLVTDEEDGIFYPVGDRACLRESTRRLLSDPVLRTRMSKAARRTAERFSLSDSMQRWRELILKGVS